jgi:hypothetical protein
MAMEEGDPGSEDPADGLDPDVIDDMPNKSRMSCHSFGDESDEDGCCCCCCCLGEGTQSPLLSAAAAAAAIAP